MRRLVYIILLFPLWGASQTHHNEETNISSATIMDIKKEKKYYDSLKVFFFNRHNKKLKKCLKHTEIEVVKQSGSIVTVFKDEKSLACKCDLIRSYFVPKKVSIHKECDAVLTSLYQWAIWMADTLFTQKKYALARDYYVYSSWIFPYEDYPLCKIDDIDKLNRQ